MLLLLEFFRYSTTHILDTNVPKVGCRTTPDWERGLVQAVYIGSRGSAAVIVAAFDNNNNNKQHKK